MAVSRSTVRISRRADIIDAGDGSDVVNRATTKDPSDRCRMLLCQSISTAQMAHVEGVVRSDQLMGLTFIDEIESGQPMLAQAAKENVKTWLFEEHSPTTFETTYRYKLLHSGCDAKCTCDSTEKDSVLLKLPAEVEVSAKELIVCEPAGDRKD